MKTQKQHAIPTDILAERISEYLRIHEIPPLSPQGCDLHNLIFHGTQYPSDTGNYCESCGAILDADDCGDVCDRCSRR